jgi:hypothetical protein
MVVKIKKSKLIPILSFLVIFLGIIGASGYYYFMQKIEKPKTIIKEKKKTMSNITFEVDKIKNILPANSIIELKFEDNNMFLKLKNGTNIEELISRYENMLKINYKKEYIMLRIRKREIRQDNTKKEQLYDYLLNKDVLMNRNTDNKKEEVIEKYFY